MAMLEDLSVFFDADDFAVPVIRQRSDAEDIGFDGILGSADVEAMQGNAMAAKHELLFASNDVVEGDTLLIGGTPYRVLADPVRGNDGAEMRAYLTDLV